MSRKTLNKAFTKVGKEPKAHVSIFFITVSRIEEWFKSMPLMLDKWLIRSCMYLGLLLK